MSLYSDQDRALLRQAILESIPDPPSQFAQVKPQFVYIPATHLQALDPDAMLIVGIPGAGKSFWWHALRDKALRPRLLAQWVRDKSELLVSAGFGEGSSSDWPDKDELSQLLTAGRKPRLIWKTVLLRHVAKTVLAEGQWNAAVQWVEQNPSQVADALRAADKSLRESSQRHLVLFDALDRTADRQVDRINLLKGLLELVLELRTYSALRAKVFVRPDMIDEPEVKAFPDASKILVSRVSLSWSPVDLYALLFTYLGNGSNEAAAERFRQLTQRTWLKRENLFEIPQELRNNQSLQEQVFTQLAGPYMGTNKRRGKTYTWVPSHLADAGDLVSPRSFLAAIRRAAEVSEATGQAHALHFSGIQQGVRKASEYRVQEIGADLPWAYKAMTMLKGLIVPCPQETLIEEWQKQGLKPQIAIDEQREPRFGDLDDTLKMLAKVRVLEILPDQRVNIPDVYRVGFMMRRHGGFRPD
jgi:hypothetical protein